MIFDADRMGPGEPCLMDYVGGLFLERSGPEQVNDLLVREVASALEAYTCHEKRNFVDTASLAVMASSAVRALGRDDLAVEAYITGTGMVYPQKLSCVEDAPVWVINTQKIFPDFEGVTELAFFSVLYRLVGGMVHFWDTSGGRGALGIRKLRKVANMFAGGKSGQKEIDRWAGMIMNSVTERISKCSIGRQWVAKPSVLMLD